MRKSMSVSVSKSVRSRAGRSGREGEGAPGVRRGATADGSRYCCRTMEKSPSLLPFESLRAPVTARDAPRGVSNGASRLCHPTNASKQREDDTGRV